MDVTYVRNISIRAEIGLDAWGARKPQPVLVTVKAWTDAMRDMRDHVNDTLDYRIINRAVAALDGRAFLTAGAFASTVQENIIREYGTERIAQLEIDVRLPKAVLGAGAGGGARRRVRFGFERVHGTLRTHVRTLKGEDTLSVEELGVLCSVGISEGERAKKQPVVVSITIDGTDSVRDSLAFGELGALVIKVTINGVTAIDVRRR